jgi:hypothetical protein
LFFAFVNRPPSVVERRTHFKTFGAKPSADRKLRLRAVSSLRSQSPLLCCRLMTICAWRSFCCSLSFQSNHRRHDCSSRPNLSRPTHPPTEDPFPDRIRSARADLVPSVLLAIGRPIDYLSLCLALPCPRAPPFTCTPSSSRHPIPPLPRHSPAPQPAACR